MVTFHEEFVVTESNILQTRCYVPSVKTSNTLVVITHPYGSFGGDMDNPVCLAVGRMCAAQNLMTVLLNFRGVGKSSGRGSWSARGEQDDLRNTIRHFRQHQVFSGKPPQLLLIGYSFGSVVAGSLLKEFESDLQGYVAIAYPFCVTWFLTLFRTSEVQGPLSNTQTVPKLFVHGTEDNFTSLRSAKKAISKYPSSALSGCEGGNHFFGNNRSLTLVVEYISQFVQRLS